MPRAVRNIFAPKSGRVLRVLLVDYGRDWNERDIAKVAKVSRGLAHYVCKTLVELGYVARNEKHRLVLVDPLRLLKRWAAYHQYDRVNKFLDYYTFEREIDRFLQNFARIDLEYAASALIGAWLVAPYVRPVDLHFYVPNRLVAEEIAKRLELNPIPRGGNIKFVLPYDEGVFYGVHNVRDTNVVSSIQLYVDLYNFPARGEEAASHLLDDILKEWQRKRGEERHV